MKKTKEVIYQGHQQNQNLISSDNVLAWWHLRKSISEYNNRFGSIITEVDKRLKHLKNEFFELDPNGNPKYGEPLLDAKGVQQQPMPIMKEGKTIEQYNKKCAEFLDEEIEI